MITEQIPKNQLNEVTNEVRLKNSIMKKDSIIDEQGKELNQKDLIINEQGKALNQKDIKIKKLESLLQKNNITFTD